VADCRLQIAAVTLLLYTQRVATDEHAIFISLTGGTAAVDLRLELTNKIDW